MPSGRLPSCRSRPTGSSTDGICALFIARHMMSRCEWRCCLGALYRQASPWSPRASTTCVVRTLCNPVSAILSCSSDSHRPTNVTGGTANQSPECVDVAVRSLAYYYYYDYSQNTIFFVEHSVHSNESVAHCIYRYLFKMVAIFR